MSMGTKRVKITDENGNVFHVNAPANATKEEVNAWVSSPEGEKSVMTAMRDREALNFRNRRSGKRLQDPTMPDNREITTGEAFRGQALAEANKLGENIGSLAKDYVPGVGLINSAVNKLFGTTDEEQAKKTKQLLSEDKAFVDKTRELGYQNYGGAAVNTAYHLAGVAFPPLRVAKLPFLANTAAQAGVQAGISAAGADDEKRAGAATSAAGGSVIGDMLVAALARAAKPVWNMSKEAKLLADKGVYSTPMAASGPTMKALEDKFMSVPGVGDSIALGRRQGIQDYNKYLITNTSGTKLQGKGYGREAFDEVTQDFNKRYDDGLAGLRLDVNDPSLQPAFNSIVRNNTLDRQGINTVDQIWNEWRRNHANPKMPINGRNTTATQPSGTFGPPTHLDGPQIQLLTQHLASKKEPFKKSADSYQQLTGQAVSDMRQELIDAVKRQNIGLGDITKLQDVDKAYARFSPIKMAANRAAASRTEGVFSPSEGLSALKEHMTKRGQGDRFLRGKGDNQDVHQAANSVLGSGYPDSGTAGRLGVTSLVLGGTGMGFNSAADTNTGYAPMAALMAYAAATASKGGRQYGLGKKFKFQDPLAEALKNARLRQGTSALGASIAGEDPSIANPEYYEPWGK